MNVYMDDVRKCPFIGWTVVRTVEECQRLLLTGEVEHLSLDHDMGACEECVKDNKHIGDMQGDRTTFYNWCPHVLDGTKLVYWMIENNVWPKEKPEVHSANPVGRDRMRGMIDRYWQDRPT